MAAPEDKVLVEIVPLLAENAYTLVALDVDGVNGVCDENGKIKSEALKVALIAQHNASPVEIFTARDKRSFQSKVLSWLQKKIQTAHTIEDLEEIINSIDAFKIEIIRQALQNHGIQISRICNVRDCMSGGFFASKTLGSYYDKTLRDFENQYCENLKTKLLKCMTTLEFSKAKSALEKALSVTARNTEKRCPQHKGDLIALRLAENARNLKKGKEPKILKVSCTGNKPREIRQIDHAILVGLHLPHAANPVYLRYKRLKNLANRAPFLKSILLDSVNYQDNEQKETLLHYVCRIGDLDCAAILMGIPGIDLKTKNKEGKTYLDVTDAQGRTLLHQSAASGQTAMVDRLIEQGADTQAQDKDGKIYLEATDAQGRTLLHHVAATGNITMIDRLVEQGADIHARDTDGKTYLEATDAQGRTLLHHIAAEGDMDRVHQLITLGANIYAIDKDDSTPLDLLKILLKIRLETVMTLKITLAILRQELKNNPSFDFLEKSLLATLEYTEFGKKYSSFLEEDIRFWRQSPSLCEPAYDVCEAYIEYCIKKLEEDLKNIETEKTLFRESEISIEILANKQKQYSGFATPKKPVAEASHSEQTLYVLQEVSPRDQTVIPVAILSNTQAKAPDPSTDMAVKEKSYYDEADIKLRINGMDFYRDCLTMDLRYRPGEGLFYMSDLAPQGEQNQSAKSGEASFENPGIERYYFEVTVENGFQIKDPTANQHRHAYFSPYNGEAKLCARFKALREYSSARNHLDKFARLTATTKRSNQTKELLNARKESIEKRKESMSKILNSENIQENESAKTAKALIDELSKDFSETNQLDPAVQKSTSKLNLDFLTKSRRKKFLNLCQVAIELDSLYETSIFEEVLDFMSKMIGFAPTKDCPNINYDAMLQAIVMLANRFFVLNKDSKNLQEKTRFKTFMKNWIDLLRENKELQIIRVTANENIVEDIKIQEAFETAYKDRKPSDQSLSQLLIFCHGCITFDQKEIEQGRPALLSQTIISFMLYEENERIRAIALTIRSVLEQISGNLSKMAQFSKLLEIFIKNLYAQSINRITPEQFIARCKKFCSKADSEILDSKEKEEEIEIIVDNSAEQPDLDPSKLFEEESIDMAFSSASVVANIPSDILVKSTPSALIYPSSTEMQDSRIISMGGSRAAPTQISSKTQDNLGAAACRGDSRAALPPGKDELNFAFSSEIGIDSHKELEPPKVDTVLENVGSNIQDLPVDMSGDSDQKESITVVEEEKESQKKEETEENIGRDQEDLQDPRFSEEIVVDANPGEKRPVALLDVDQTLLVGNELNERLLINLKLRGILDVYLFTDMLGDYPTVKERMELIAELERRDFRVRGVITPSDVTWNSPKNSFFLPREKQMGQAFKDIADKLDQIQKKCPSQLLARKNAGDEKEYLEKNHSEEYRAYKEIAERISDCKTVCDHIAQQKDYVDPKGCALELFLEEKEPWVGDIYVFDDKVKVIETINKVANKQAAVATIKAIHVKAREVVPYEENLLLMPGKIYVEKVGDQIRCWQKNENDEKIFSDVSFKQLLEDPQDLTPGFLSKNASIIVRKVIPGVSELDMHQALYDEALGKASIALNDIEVNISLQKQKHEQEHEQEQEHGRKQQHEQEQKPQDTSEVSTEVKEEEKTHLDFDGNFALRVIAGGLLIGAGATLFAAGILLGLGYFASVFPTFGLSLPAGVPAAMVTAGTVLAGVGLITAGLYTLGVFSRKEDKSFPEKNCFSALNIFLP